MTFDYDILLGMSAANGLSEKAAKALVWIVEGPRSPEMTHELMLLLYLEAKQEELMRAVMAVMGLPLDKNSPEPERSLRTRMGYFSLDLAFGHEQSNRLRRKKLTSELERHVQSHQKYLEAESRSFDEISAPRARERMEQFIRDYDARYEHDEAFFLLSDALAETHAYYDEVSDHFVDKLEVLRAEGEPAQYAPLQEILALNKETMSRRDAETAKFRRAFRDSSLGDGERVHETWRERALSFCPSEDRELVQRAIEWSERRFDIFGVLLDIDAIRFEERRALDRMLDAINMSCEQGTAHHRAMQTELAHQCGLRDPEQDAARHERLIAEYELDREYAMQEFDTLREEYRVGYASNPEVPRWARQVREAVSQREARERAVWEMVRRKGEESEGREVREAANRAMGYAATYARGAASPLALDEARALVRNLLGIESDDVASRKDGAP